MTTRLSKNMDTQNVADTYSAHARAAKTRQSVSQILVGPEQLRCAYKNRSLSETVAHPHPHPHKQEPAPGRQWLSGSGCQTCQWVPDTHVSLGMSACNRGICAPINAHQTHRTSKVSTWIRQRSAYHAAARAAVHDTSVGPHPRDLRLAERPSGAYRARHRPERAAVHAAATEQPPAEPRRCCPAEPSSRGHFLCPH